MYSLAGKVPIGIVRKPVETPAVTVQNSASKTQGDDTEVKAWFERKKQGVYANLDQAKRTLDELLPKLKTHHTMHHHQGVSPVDFANKFVGTFARPYSDHRRTSMRFYAAFGAARTPTEPTHSDVID